MSRNGRLPRVLVPTPIVQFYAEMGRPFALTIVSASMSPLIRVGDQVIVDPSRRDCAPGIIVAFALHEAILVHRVIKVRSSSDRPATIVTKGDRSPRSDPAMPLEAVIGTVVRLRRGQREVDISGRGWRWINRLLLVLSLTGMIATRARSALRRRLPL